MVCCVCLCVCLHVCWSPSSFRLSTPLHLSRSLCLSGSLLFLSPSLPLSLSLSLSLSLHTYTQTEPKRDQADSILMKRDRSGRQSEFLLPPVLKVRPAASEPTPLPPN